MKESEKFELVLDLFRRTSWKPSVDDFSDLRNVLGKETCEEPWFNVFTRDYLYVKSGLVNTRNISRAQTFLECLIKKFTTPEEEEQKTKTRIEVGKAKTEIEKLRETISEKDALIQELEEKLKEKEEKLIALSNDSYNTIKELKDKYRQVIKEKTFKISSLGTSKKYWEEKSKRLELTLESTKLELTETRRKLRKKYDKETDGNE